MPSLMPKRWHSSAFSLQGWALEYTDQRRKMEAATKTINTQPIPIIANIHTFKSSSSATNVQYLWVNFTYYINSLCNYTLLIYYSCSYYYIPIILYHLNLFSQFVIWTKANSKVEGWCTILRKQMAVEFLGLTNFNSDQLNDHTWIVEPGLDLSLLQARKLWLHYSSVNAVAPSALPLTQCRLALAITTTCKYTLTHFGISFQISLFKTLYTSIHE